MSEQPPPNPFDPPQPAAPPTAYPAPPTAPTPPAYGQSPAPTYGQPPAPPAPPAYGPPGSPPPGYAPTGYPPQGYPGQGYAPQKSTNGLAIAGLVVTIVSLLACWFPFVGAGLAVVGLGLAIAGLVRSRRIGSGKGMAIAAIIIGALALLLGAVFTVLVVRVLDCTKPGLTNVQQQTCIENKIRNG